VPSFLPCQQCGDITIKTQCRHNPTNPVIGVCDYRRGIIIIILSGMGLSPLGTAATTGLLYQPQMIDDGDCGTVGGMKIGRGNRSTRRKPVPVPLCPPQSPHDLTRARTRAAAVGSQRLTAWARARPRRDVDWCKDLLTTCIHHLELHFTDHWHTD
jgi:hypothetical protein